MCHVFMKQAAFIQYNDPIIWEIKLRETFQCRYRKQKDYHTLNSTTHGNQDSFVEYWAVFVKLQNVDSTI